MGDCCIKAFEANWDDDDFVSPLLFFSLFLFPFVYLFIFLSHFPPFLLTNMLRRASDFTTLQHSLESKFPSSSSGEVKLTHTVTKEYDAETGNKLINNFMIIKEIGRGVHGKVKLAQDLTTGELVVSLYLFNNDKH